MEDSLHLYPNCAHNRGLTWKARPYGNTTPIVDFIIFQKGDLEGLNALLLMLLFKVIKGRCCSERALLCVLFLVCNCDMSRGGGRGGGGDNNIRVPVNKAQTDRADLER